jgi:hypothetical protein
MPFAKKKPLKWTLFPKLIKKKDNTFAEIATHHKWNLIAMQKDKNEAINFHETMHPWRI